MTKTFRITHNRKQTYSLMFQGIGIGMHMQGKKVVLEHSRELEQNGSFTKHQVTKIFNSTHKRIPTYHLIFQ